MVARFTVGSDDVRIGWYWQRDRAVGGSQPYRNIFGQDIQINLHVNDMLGAAYNDNWGLIEATVVTWPA
jgi:hypothetical protein